MVEFNERDCLAADPFQGDFGAPGDKVLKNRIVTARKPATCNDCVMDIAPGERCRSMTAKFDGDLMWYRWCSLCCAAMALSFHDSGEAWEARIRLGNEARATDARRAAIAAQGTGDEP